MKHFNHSSVRWTLRAALVAASLITVTLPIACSSKSTAKKPATGQAARKTTTKPSTTPKPTQKTASSVTANTSNAATAEGETCTSTEEGLGACIDDFVVFCAGSVVYALDCNAAFAGTCGTVDGQVGCRDDNRGASDYARAARAVSSSVVNSR